MLGGLLVAVAVALALQAVGSEATEPTATYLVAATDLEVGDELTPEDVASVALHLPSTQAANALPAPTDVTGAVALGPIRRGQLLAASDLLRAAADTGADPVRELSVPVATERALDGHVVAGEVVDVLATAGTGAEASTELVAAHVRVLAVSSPDDSLGRAGTVVLTLAVPDDATALAVAHAGATADLSIVRGVTR